ncbi:glycosyltransferase [Acinetobacter ursingii]|uniref:glycosyltransferase n=1 Tax=Acinetobacter ursingii TaxID=108980 RepID=UPI0021D0E560|nr:glycosyltransferase [Acinetobacter ursingii]MCU4570587.1 glycosyltransferase [Acinetobacter ursingii]
MAFKIIFVVPDLKVGGVTSIVKNISEGIANYGYEVTVITLFNKKDLDLDKNVKIISLNINYNLISWLFGLYNYLKIIKDIKPNVVHSHTMYSHFLTCIGAYFFKAYKLICSEHGTYMGELKFYKRMNLFRLLNTQADLITNVSQASCNSYVEKGIVPETKIRTVYNGINLNHYQFCEVDRISYRKSLNIMPKEKVIGFVGRLSKEKNLDNLIKSATLLEGSFKLLIIGTGDEEDRLKKEVDKLKMAEKILFLGEVKDPRPYYSVFDVLVLSSNTEGLPTVILEAIATKCIVVSTDCGGVREIFLKGYPYLAKVNDSKQLSMKLNDVLALSRSENLLICDTNMIRLQKKFSYKSMLSKWWSIYHEL